MTLPVASELILTPGEETPDVSRAHDRILKALLGQNLAAAQRLTADLIELLDAQPSRKTAPKTVRLIDFVVMLS